MTALRRFCRASTPKMAAMLGQSISPYRWLKNLGAGGMGVDYEAHLHPALKFVSHRPWPLPTAEWIMAQTWNDLLFAHWPIEPKVLRPLVPVQLSLDSFDGRCWLAVTPFHMSNIRGRSLPPLPGLSRFPELNVRTYVAVGGKPGVYFFSLDAANLPAVWAARSFYRLPYFHARMSVSGDEHGISYYSRRYQTHAELRARYAALGPVQLRQPGTLEYWLTERYCLYTVANGRVYRADIHHEQWPLHNAEAEIESNTMASAASIELPDTKPLLHFAKKLEVLIWPLQQLALSFHA
jgi:uncharacterized protein YqjF (DUF2071 family)